MTEVTHSNEPLILDLVDRVTRAPRSYSEVMTAWRTSCPGSRFGRMRWIGASFPTAQATTGVYALQ